MLVALQGLFSLERWTAAELAVALLLSLQGFHLLCMFCIGKSVYCFPVGGGMQANVQGGILQSKSQCCMYWQRTAAWGRFVM